MNKWITIPLLCLASLSAYGQNIPGALPYKLPITVVTQKWFGYGPPTAALNYGDLPGDTYIDLTNNNEYWCAAQVAAFNAPPACTSVTTGGWTLVGGASGNGAQVISVAPAASMTFTATSNTITRFVAGAAGSPTQLTANVTAMTFPGLTAGQEFSVQFQQNLTLGPFTVGGWPSGFNTACQISAYPGAVTTIGFIATATGATETYCPPDRGPSQLPIVTFNGDPPAGYLWFGTSSTYNTIRARANSQNFFMPTFTPPLTNHGVLLGGDGVQINATDAPGAGTAFNGLGSLLDPIWSYHPVYGLNGFTGFAADWCGLTSGCATITTQSVQGTPTLTLPTGTGTFAVSASAPLVLNTTTGNLTYPGPVEDYGGSFGFPQSATALTTGQVMYFRVKQGCALQAWNILISPADTATVKYWKIASGTAIPTVSNSISTSGVGITTLTAVRSTTLTDFGANTSWTAGDIGAVTITAIGGTAVWLSAFVECQ